MADLFVLLLGGGASSLLGFFVSNWALKRRTYALECAVADLEDQLLRELKKRAALTTRGELTDLRSLLNRGAEPVKPKEPWYMDFVNPELKKAH